MKCVGQKGSKKGEFNDPHGIMLYGNQVYFSLHKLMIFIAYASAEINEIHRWKVWSVFVSD